MYNDSPDHGNEKATRPRSRLRHRRHEPRQTEGELGRKEDQERLISAIPDRLQDPRYQRPLRGQLR